MGRERYAIRTLRLAGDSKHRIDSHLGARLGSGRYDAGWSLLSACSSEEARITRCAGDGERYP